MLQEGRGAVGKRGVERSFEKPKIETWAPGSLRGSAERPGCNAGGRGEGNQEASKSCNFWLGHHGELARMSGHREAAAADAAGRPGCNEKVGGREPRSFEKLKKLRLGQHWKLARMSSHGEAAAAPQWGRGSKKKLRKAKKLWSGSTGRG